MIINRIDFEYSREFLDAYGERFRAEWEDDYQAFRNDFELSESEKERFSELMIERGLVIDNEYDEATVVDDTLYVSQETYNELVELNYGRVKAEIARMVWGNEYFYPINNDYFNETLHAAMNLWDSAEQLEMFVQGKVSNIPSFESY